MFSFVVDFLRLIRKSSCIAVAWYSHVLNRLCVVIGRQW